MICNDSREGAVSGSSRVERDLAGEKNDSVHFLVFSLAGVLTLSLGPAYFEGY